jgi:hypothetical protein
VYVVYELQLPMSSCLCIVSHFFKLSSIRLDLKCGFVCPKYSPVPVSSNLCVRKWGKTKEKMEAEGMGLIPVF